MNKICINPELDELKEIYDRASEDTYIGKYRGLNLISAHNSTLGVEDKNSIRSSRLPLLRLHRKTDSKECLNNREIGLISFVCDSTFEYLPSFFPSELTSGHPIKLKDIKCKSENETVAHYMIDNLEVFAWYPILLDLEKSNYIIRELVTKDKSKDKLEDLLISF